MLNTSSAFVFVHGPWRMRWYLVAALFEVRGHVVRALDLAGAGRNAIAPRTYGRRPLDPAAFATEPSPNAHVTQQERTRAVVGSIQELHEYGLTRTRALAASHSPFYSQRSALADILAGIAANPKAIIDPRESMRA
jgi:hypothetical protein